MTQAASTLRQNPNPHCQTLFDFEQHGEEQLARAIRRLPLGGTIKLLHSAVAITRVEGGRRFALSVPPKVHTAIKVDQDGLKSASTAYGVLIQAHKDIVAQLAPVGGE